MTSIKTLLAAVAVVAVASTPALAQTKPAAKAKAPAAASAAAAAKPAAASMPPLTLGAAIPGVCLFSEEGAVGRSSAGESINKRMQQLAAQVQAELGPEQTSLDADIKAFKEKAASLTQDQQQAQGQALQQRMQDFDVKRNQRQKELEATLRKAIGRVDAELEPIVRTVISGRSCGMLLKADTAIYAANPQMDITSAVIEQLNTKLPTVTFDREHLDQQAAQQR
jgi:Skp family chaperone for outer membrane proteins